MKLLIRCLIVAACMGTGLWLLGLSYEAYAKWLEYVTLGDYSGAEAYEVEFWVEIVVGVLLVVLGGFLLGRTSSHR